jgi:hypothetical protein
MGVYDTQEKILFGQPQAKQIGADVITNIIVFRLRKNDARDPVFQVSE